MKKIILILALLFCGFTNYAEEKIITTSDGVSLYVRVKGQGTPLLFVHGGPGSASLWFEQFVGEFMEKYFTMIYLDQRGVGRSGSPKNGDFSMNRMIADFEEVRIALGFENWLTLGHSFGGLLQMGYAERFPAAQKGMLMINCTLNITQTCCESWLPKAAEFLGEDFIPCDEDSTPVMERMAYYGNKLREKNVFWKMAYKDEKHEEVVNNTALAIPNFNYDFSNVAMSNPEFWKNFKPLTSEIQTPVLFFYGSQDWMIGPDHHKDLKFPNMMLFKSDVGHMPFLEAKEDLSKAILTFKEKYKL